MRPRSLSRARTGADPGGSPWTWNDMLLLFGGILALGVVVVLTASPAQRRWLVRASGTPVPGKNGRY